VSDKSTRLRLAATDFKVGPSKKQRLTHILSTTLIFAGLALIGLGLWVPLQDFIVMEENPPPPLPPEAIELPEMALLPNADGSSLSDNPLPAFDVVVVEATATPLPTLTPEVVDQPDLAVVLAEAATPTPAPATPTPLPTPTPTTNPFPPAQSPPTRIVAGSIGLDSEVVVVGWHKEAMNGQEMSVWVVADYAAGWHKNSALPGHEGNIVLSGHHNIMGEVFRYIVDLEPGDFITLYADDRPYFYKVESKFIVKDKGEPNEVRYQNARWIGPFTDQRLTLIACWPYTNNTHRVIVIAKPVLEAETRPGLQES
jgi:sortase A